ncbi:LysR family transcriptional regulator [Modestobacter altitudinis]|uniref:LysR family transcriptional regulator n=1 Tax=Modestobacter altitudinis TaxID=2213158 RepID=UPI00110CB897|nr:LysR family transcriptional regulator [Modestobacter altitudinis]
MDLGAFDLNTLAALGAVLEEGNLTRAGAKVGMAQPAMSGVLGRYRRHFNDELLVRVGREYQLTPLARDLLPQVQEALRLLREALRVTDVFDPRTSDRVYTVTASDYAMTVLLEPLRRRVREKAPSVRLRFVDLPDDLVNSPGALLRYDLVVGPLGFGFAGEHTFLFHDRLVCLVARDNPYLRDGGLDLDALQAMPHAVTVFHNDAVTPMDRVLGQLRIVRRVAIQARGFLLLPFAVLGTEAVAVVPERLVHRFLADERFRLVEPPFGFVDMLETAWWHASRTVDAGHRWLVGVLEEVAVELAVDEPAQASAQPPSPAEAGQLMPGMPRPTVPGDATSA